MKTLYLSKKPIVTKELLKTSACEEDFSVLVKEDTIIYDADTKDLVAIYI